MVSTSKWLSLFSVLALSLFINSVSAETTLSRSVYKGSISGWKAEMVRTLSEISPDRFSFKSEADNMFASIKETSEFALKNDRLVPLSYVYERRVFGRNAVEKIAFDWDAGVAHYTRSDRTKNNTSHKIEPGYLDPALYQLVMQADLAHGHSPLSYSFVKRKRIETYEFSKLAEEKLNIGKQSYATEIVLREDQQKAKSTRIWVVPALDYQVGQILHTDDGDTYQIRLTDYEGDSAALKNLYERIARTTRRQQ